MILVPGFVFAHGILFLFGLLFYQSKRVYDIARRHLWNKFNLIFKNQQIFFRIILSLRVKYKAKSKQTQHQIVSRTEF